MQIRRAKTALILTTILAAPCAGIAPVPAQTLPPPSPEAAAESTPAQDVPAPESPPPETPVPETAPPEAPPGPPGRKRAPPAQVSSGETLVVTGTRLRTQDPSSDVKVYTADDIKALGVSNVQDFMRTLPQNQVSVGTGMNNRANTEIRFDDGGLGGLGVGGVNLRGLGTKNTLVLVNGRRMAGAAGIEEGFANINNIPLAAIDRVEISLGGGSSIYGSDALGGVVNFILKRGYTGFTVGTRTELSSTGAHTAQWTGSGAVAWSSGSLSGTASYTRIKPSLNARLGYTSHDYTDRIDAATLARIGRTAFPRDQRSPEDGAQPGILRLGYQAPGADPDMFEFFSGDFQWHGGSDHANPPFSGLQPVDPATLVSNVPADAGEHQSNLGFSASLEQKITDRLRLTIDYLGSVNTARLREVQEVLNLGNVPFDQAYNPVSAADLPAGFSDAVTSVYYFPTAEYADGRLAEGFQKTTGRSHTVTGGLVYDIDDDTSLRGNYTYSHTSMSGSQSNLRNVTVIDHLTGLCGADDAGIAAQGLEIANLAAIAAAQCAALTSSDPALAFDFLSDGTATGGAPIRTFFIGDQRIANSSGQSYGDALFTAAPFSLPAGKVRIAVGSEYRSNRVDGERIRERTTKPASNSIFAAYAELRVPLVDDDMDVPLIHNLELSGSARYDRYDSSGPVGTEDGIAFGEGGTLVEGRATFDRISPRIGLAWYPTPTLSLRGAWSSNFTPPPFTSLYDVDAGLIGSVFLYIDPLAPDGNIYQYRDIELLTAANPLLRPEVSRSYYLIGNWTPTGPLFGLNVEVSYYKTRIEDQIGTSIDLATIVPPEFYYGVDEFFQRDAGGNIVSQTIKPINIGTLSTDSIDVKVDYFFPTRFGTFTPSLYYIRNLSQRRQPLAGGNWTDTVGRANGLDRYRIIGSLDYQHGAFSARVTGRYIPPYKNDYGMQYDGGVPADTDFDGTPDQPFPVGGLTTFDVAGSWRYDDAVTITFGGRNIFKAAPPFALIDRRPFDASRYDIRGRVLYLEARLSF